MKRRIVLVVYEGFQLLDLAGPADVFAAADLVTRGGYQVEVTAPMAGPVAAQHGVEVAVRTPLREVGGPIDTLVVAGGHDHDDARPRPGDAGGDRQAVAGGPPHRVRVQRRVPAGGGGAARRPSGPPPTGWSPTSSARGTPGSRSSRTRSTSATATSGPRPGSAPAWTWRSRWWPTTTVTSWPGGWPAGWSSTCTGPAGRASSACR
ncbi:DJ-1/PfpI family protein [Nonomuraea ferruginea]